MAVMLQVEVFWVVTLYY